MAFNTAPKHGKLARLEKNNVAVDFMGEWTLNVNLDLADVSRQGQHWKESLPGQAGWTATAKGHLVLGNTEQKALVDNIVAAVPGTELTDIKLLIDSSTNAWVGNCFLNGLGTSGAVGDKIPVDFTMTGNGALTLTDAA